MPAGRTVAAHGVCAVCACPRRRSAATHGQEWCSRYWAGRRRARSHPPAHWREPDASRPVQDCAGGPGAARPARPPVPEDGKRSDNGRPDGAARAGGAGPGRPAGRRVAGRGRAAKRGARPGKHSAGAGKEVAMRALGGREARGRDKHGAWRHRRRLMIGLAACGTTVAGAGAAREAGPREGGIAGREGPPPAVNPGGAMMPAGVTKHVLLCAGGPGADPDDLHQDDLAAAPACPRGAAHRVHRPGPGHRAADGHAAVRAAEQCPSAR